MHVINFCLKHKLTATTKRKQKRNGPRMILWSNSSLSHSPLVSTKELTYHALITS